MYVQTNSSTLSPEDNKQLAEEFNDELRSTLRPVTAFVGVETVFGFFGNVLILYVFVFRYHKCNFKYFVLCLSFVDITSTLTTMPGEIVTQTFWYIYPVPLVCKIKSFFNVFTVCGSMYGLLVISIDRFRKICRPLGWQIKPNLARILCFVQLTISFVMALPVAFFWGTHSFVAQYKGYNITVTVCEIDEEFTSTDYPLRYTIVIETINSIVMFVMVVIYIFIGRKLFGYKSSGTKASVPAESSHTDTELSSGMTSDEEQRAEEKVRSVHATAEFDERAKERVRSVHSIEELDTSREAARQVKTEDNKTVHFLSLHRKDSQKSVFSNIRSKENGSTKTPTRKKIGKKVKRKTLIMFILTALFIFTTIMYMTLLSLIANDVLQTLSNSQKAAYFFFFRFYFINHVINPILYGFLDPRFRSILKETFRCN